MADEDVTKGSRRAAKPKSKDSIANTDAHKGLHVEGWAFFDRFDFTGKLQIRHNKHVQKSETVEHEADFVPYLKDLADRCGAAPGGNPKITGAIKVAEHTTLNGLPLLVAMNRAINRALRPGSRFDHSEK